MISAIKNIEQGVMVGGGWSGKASEVKLELGLNSERELSLNLLAMKRFG